MLNPCLVILLFLRHGQTALWLSAVSPDEDEEASDPLDLTLGACREVAGEERRRELYAPPDAGLMLRCSRYSSVTVLLSQYAKHALLSCWRSIWPPIALITCMQPCNYRPVPSYRLDNMVVFSLMCCSCISHRSGHQP